MNITDLEEPERSSDVSDQATDREMRDREALIEHARRQANAPMPEFCLNDCGEKPREGSRYCSKECLLDHQERMERRRRQGVRV
ncbi:MAG TPA: hypothetical protein VJ652_15280 [Noviherbaspirillum sp.]|nr:hypothetical protein [Noviherbaspirillum sp.]